MFPYHLFFWVQVEDATLECHPFSIENDARGQKPKSCLYSHMDCCQPAVLKEENDERLTLHDLQLQQEIVFRPKWTTTIDQHKEHTSQRPPAKPYMLERLVAG